MDRAVALDEELVDEVEKKGFPILAEPHEMLL